MPLKSAILNTQSFDVGRKTFTVDLVENERGQCLRITEKAGHHRNFIVLDVAAKDALVSALQSVAPF